MDVRQHRFLNSILGSDGAQALTRAAERSKTLGNAILPRAILSWLGLAARFEHEGEIPGNPNTFCVFRKSESGFSGSIKVGGELYTFTDASLYRVAAGIGVALGADTQPLSKELRDLDLVRLGKTLDALVKTKVFNEELRKAVINRIGSPPMTVYRMENERGEGPYTGGAKVPSPSSWEQSPPAIDDFPRRDRGILGLGPLGSSSSLIYGFEKPEHAHEWFGPEGIKQLTRQGYQLKPRLASLVLRSKSGRQLAFMPHHEEVQKADLPGQTAQPQQQQGPIAPEAPKKQPKQGRPPLPSLRVGKLPSLKIGKSESQRSCEVCSRPQFRDNKFVGCACLSDLAKSVSTTAYADGYVLRFEGPEWDDDNRLTIIRAVTGDQYGR